MEGMRGHVPHWQSVYYSELTTCSEPPNPIKLWQMDTIKHPQTSARARMHRCRSYQPAFALVPSTTHCPPNSSARYFIGLMSPPLLPRVPCCCKLIGRLASKECGCQLVEQAGKRPHMLLSLSRALHLLSPSISSVALLLLQELYSSHQFFVQQRVA